MFEARKLEIIVFLYNFMQSVWKVLSTKVEIKLKKKDGHHWSKLEGDGLDPLKSASAISKTDTAFKSTKGRDWSKIERDIEKVIIFLYLTVTLGYNYHEFNESSINFNN